MDSCQPSINPGGAHSSTTLSPTPIKSLPPSSELHKRDLHLHCTCSEESVLASERGIVMAQGRGSVVALGLALLCLLIHSEVAEAATYVVGGNSGWTFNVASWPRGKSFRAGDVLVFNYNPSVHNVVAVSAAGYNSCSAPKGSRVYTSGKDRITLARGTNYFICSFAGHCQSGMKIAVTAA
ncbi:basic blue protein-like [Musa acuminata AAA Group]